VQVKQSGQWIFVDRWLGEEAYRLEQQLEGQAWQESEILLLEGQVESW
jgi:hypothetical protein